MDSLSDNCLKFISNVYDVVKTVFETEGLLAQSEEFCTYCENIINFVTVEKFYMFTTVNLV
jgi:hypothetical protein